MTQSQQLIRSYLCRSAGNCNIPTDHTIRCFVGMIETGECRWEDFRRVAGKTIVRRMTAMMRAIREGVA